MITKTIRNDSSANRAIQVLVVEDERVVARDLQDCLTSLGYSVPAIASSGAEAIERASQLRPDLVLMDIRLQGEMDGIQAAERIWNHLHIPIIYSTGYSDPHTLNRAKTTAPFGYILKPVEERELYVAIETALQRFQLETALQQREQWLTRILSQMGDGIIVVDTQGSVKFLNLTAEALTGWRQEDALGRPVSDIFQLVHEPTTLLPNSAVEALRTGTRVYLTDKTVLVSKTGTPIPISDSAVPFRDDTGVINGVMLVFREVAEQRLTDGIGRQILNGMSFEHCDRQRLEAALHASEAKFRRLVNANFMGVFVANVQGIVEANDVFLEMLHYTQADLAAGKIRWQDMAPEAYINLDQPDLPAIEVSGDLTPFEKEYIRKDGSRVLLLMGVALLEPSPLTWVCFVVDLTERKQLAVEREKLLQQEQYAREQAEASHRIKDEIFGMLSHELRTPLTPILGFSQLLRTVQLNPKDTHQALDTIERSANLQVQLIKDLLDSSDLWYGKIVLNAHPINLVTVLEAALATVRLSVEAKSIQLHTFLDATGVQVIGDPARLQQVLWHLLANAVKFTPAGGRVEVRLEPLGSFAQIQIKDTGKGISPDFLPFVFEHFRQADSSTTRKFGGLGLGLSLSRHLIELHGGTIQVASPGEGLGTTLTVQLPLQSLMILNQ
ncbi:MAG: ATP-binding protein [Leptolyngbyaceae bacterium]|nr:ATP-binding protein [Leptolyngbyaceae bacterium]